MIYKRAWQILRSHPRAIVPSIAAVIVGAGILYITSALGAVWNVVGMLLAMILVDAGRTMTLQDLAGVRRNWKNVAARICIDMGFWAMLLILLIVIPVVSAFAISLNNYGAAAAVGLLWYYILAIYVYYIFKFFTMGYRLAVMGESTEEALLNAARDFEKNRKAVVKNSILYWALALVWFAGNYITEVTGNAAIAVGTLLLTGAIVIPFMEAVYVASNGQ